MAYPDATASSPFGFRLTRQPVLSVSELAGGLRTLVEEHFDEVCVEGEISNFKRYSSGHCYFSLKDASAQLRCVMWRSYAQQVFFEPKDGIAVRAVAKPSVYEARGELQLVVRSMQLAGEGALQKVFEALKQKLAAQGLFDPLRKRPLPSFPERIGIVTSADGAVLHDITSIIARRFRSASLVVCPARVQGMGAAEEIAAAVRAFNAVPADDPRRVEVLIVARGGGSMEDLWAFNEEVVAQAIHASGIPVVSAVGHETDYTIADYVADVRAATPSMAAELVTPEAREIRAWLSAAHVSMRQNLLQRINSCRQQIRAQVGSHAFRRPAQTLGQHRQRLDDLMYRLQQATGHLTRSRRAAVTSLSARLALLDPSRPLRNGYVRVLREGKPVRSAAELNPDDAVVLMLHDGTRHARIES